MRRLAVLALLAALLALPAAASASPLNFITISPSVVNNGASATGTVSLSFLDPAPTVVKLFSSDTFAAQVPATMTVPPNTMEATFTITTNAAAPPTGVQIMAAVDNVPRTANMSVNTAVPAGSPTLSSVSVTPTSVTGGSGVTGKVTFTGAMTQGANVFLKSSNTSAATVPSETVVNAGQSSGAFVVTTKPVSSTTNVTITATWLGIVRTATLTVAPGAPAAADVVRITRAEWKSGLLRIEATSTNAKAVLGVYSRAGNFMFNLTNNGGGRYSDQRGFVDRVTFIEVRSNFGGRATANVGG